MCDMILRAAKKLIGNARIVEKSVASRPMAMVWIMEPAAKVLVLLPGAARPRLTSHVGEGVASMPPMICTRLSLTRIGPATGRPASLSPR